MSCRYYRARHETVPRYIPVLLESQRHTGRSLHKYPYIYIPETKTIGRYEFSTNDEKNAIYVIGSRFKEPLLVFKLFFGTGFYRLHRMHLATKKMMNIYRFLRAQPK
jgi:hypothetical protein